MRRRRNVFLVLIMTIIFAMVLTTVALAGGYRPFGNQGEELYVGKSGEELGKGTNQYGPPNGPAGARSPHGNFSDSTNFCKTCHAVHLAGEAGYLPGTSDPRGDAWRLLRASSAQDECEYCHEPAGAHTVLVQYTLKKRNTLSSSEFDDDPIVNQLAFGEHSIGASSIPDSNIDGDGGNDSPLPGAAGLTCNTCHSVHGANTLLGVAAASDWQNKILRIDPAGNGGTVANGIRDIPAADPTHPGYAGTPINANTVIMGFCGDCHTLNVSWTDATDVRTNPHAHPMNTDGVVEINGVPTAVSDQMAAECKSCHAARSTADGGPSNFPHQSVSHKLLYDGPSMPPPQVGYQPPQYTLDAGVDITDAGRQLPSMDMVCLKCHGGLVGITF